MFISITNKIFVYFVVMTKKLDLTVWITQQALADTLSEKMGRKVAVQNIHNWVQRGKIEWQYLPGSTIKLVNKNTITVSDSHYKRMK